MTLPLVLLGALALGAGALNATVFHFTPLDHFLESAFEKFDNIKLAARQRTA